MVCELEGPIPTLKMSKTLRVMGANLGGTERSSTERRPPLKSATPP
jgi:hypothetical protein